MMLGWHFLASTRTLRTGELVQTGEQYTALGPLVLCRNGMHASRRVLDALTYAPGPIVCRVRLLGETVHDTDKAVARTRQVLWLAEATDLLHEFALSVATNALCSTNMTDTHCWRTLDVKRRWVQGDATNKELAAAKAAAWAAARATVRVTARVTARAAAQAAAGASSGAAAQDIAMEAALEATRAAARAAAWDTLQDTAVNATTSLGAAGAAAWDAAWAAYNVQLETMLESLR